MPRLLPRVVLHPLGEELIVAEPAHADWCVSVQPIHEDGPCNCKGHVDPRCSECDTRRRTMPAKFEALFNFMRKDGIGLTLSQEQAVKRFLCS
jgi:hypothetical protein